MATKKEILDLLKNDVISVDEAVEMLGKLEQQPSVVEEKSMETEAKNPELSYREKVEKIVQDTVNDMDFDYVFKVMQDKNWTYIGNSFHEHPVTKVEVRNCMEQCVREAVRNMVLNCENDAYFDSRVSIGGFEAHAWVDEGDTAVQVELNFIPATAFGGNIDIEELISNYSNDDDRDEDYTHSAINKL